MSEDIKVIQKSMIGSDTIQIAEQNNYYGMTSEEASSLALKLFMDNFPNLQEIAAKVAKERAEELCNNILKELEKQGKTDYSEFFDPDMQYIFIKSQQEYARFGNKELLDLLSGILINRIDYNDNQYMKILLDEAIEVAKSLTPKHLNYISLIFVTKHVLFEDIDMIEKLEDRLKYICSSLPISPNIDSCCPFLIMIGVLCINLGTAEELLGKTYSIDSGLIKNILPDEIKKVPGDYGLTPLGILLAIINLHNKTHFSFEFEKWIEVV